ncbi:hypothetical protein Droror1_Dr00002946 [Drosera rotundifolia]
MLAKYKHASDAQSHGRSHCKVSSQLALGVWVMNSRDENRARANLCLNNPFQLPCVTQCLSDELQRRNFFAVSSLFHLFEHHRTILYLPLAIFLIKQKLMLSNVELKAHTKGKNKCTRDQIQ